MPKAEPAPATLYDPDRYYDLQVVKPVYDGPFKYLPRDHIQARGDLINRLIEEYGADVIRSAVERQ